jgi:hypothetical protein
MLSIGTSAGAAQANGHQAPKRQTLTDLSEISDMGVTVAT